MNDKSNILSGLMPRQTANSGNTTSNQANDKENAHNIRLTGNLPTTGTHSGKVTSSSAATGKQHKLKQRFTVIRKLGKGTYGKVQLAINKKTGQEVAIKTIKKTKIESEQDLQRVKREIQIMSSIEHPHIIHIYEVFENKDKIVLVMQYAPGGELFEYVSQSKNLDDNEARRLFRQIATAIYYCHQNKICHRDLKLENILLDEKNNAKLADFGLSNVFDKQRQLSTFCGSPLYASPEIVRGSPYEGPEVDCWSLGVLLYTLVYGAMPFDGSNFKRLVKQISEACYFEPKQKSLASPLIRRLLCADPACRATILDICADPWVNNMMPTSPLGSHLPISESGQQQQAHNSLLKVAQDMANLTPVRFDILLALVPSLTDAPQTNARNRPPLARISDRVADGKGSAPTGDAARQQRESIALALDPTRIMEVDETRASSPVASYIVRDLDVEHRHEQDQEAGARETAQLSVDSQQPDLSVNTALEDTSDQNMSAQSASGRVETDEPSEMQTDPDKTEEQQLLPPSPQEQQPIPEQPVEEPAEESHAEPVKEETQDQAVDVPEPKVEDEEVRMEVDVTQSQVLEQSEQPDGDTKVPQETNESETSKKDDTEKSDNVGEEGKPKKVKKKIVVVKKKKKVLKKDNETDPGKTEKEAQGPDKMPERKSSGDKQQVDPQQKKTTKVGSKSPGKVRIPNTFQATNDNKEPPAAPRTGAEGRRPSALVVDVSQKLLMQQQQQQPSPTPAQVPNARVTDKKNEFERRASLASAQVQLVSGSGKGSSQELVDDSSTKEPERVEPQLVRELLNPLGQIEQTIVEPVTKIEALQVAPATLLSPPAYESQTPTGIAEPQTEEDAQRRLAEWTGKLDEVRRKNSQQRLSLDSDAAAHDNRSDSAETLKADLLDSPSVQDNVRSSLQISMKGPEAAQGQFQTVVPRADVSAVGPAPITRSYKKVTFTKDGACVTETGKIYATQCDDGTVRRIERKSKITHYPAGDGLMGSATSISERKREVAFETGKIGERSSWQSSFQGKKSSSSSVGQPQLRPFEKLIMPSSGMASSMLAAQLTEDEDDIDELGSEFTRRLFSRQSLGRADSDASSCSSGSTDVFDDIFDTWTGAISMFNQNNNRNLMRRLGSGSLLDPVNEPLFNDSPMSGFRSMFNRRTGRHSAQDGSQPTSSSGAPPRCGSVEPRQMRAKGRHRHERWPAAGVETSGYESDAPLDRPASALAGNPRTRHGFGGLFSDETDDVFGGDLLRDLEQEHENLKQRLAERHRQLWKGSTPSLLSSADSGSFHDKQAPPRTRPSHSNLWPREDVDPGRQEREAAPHRPRSSSGSQSCSIQQQQSHHREPVWPRHATEGVRNASMEGQQVGQSQSSSSFLKQSIALDPSPIRRNHANLPAEHQLPPRQVQPMRRSISKTSLTTGQVNSSDGRQMTSEKHSACFIQLKRTASGQQENLQKQNVESLVTSTTSAKLISSKSAATSGSSATNREGDDLAPVPATSSGFQQVSSSAGESSKQMESRIQSWLQESSGNLSASSGSKSSISTSLNEATSAQNDLKNKPEPFSGILLETVSPKRDGNLASQLDDRLPLKIGGTSSSQTRVTADSTAVKSSGSKQQIVKHSTSSTIVVTSSSSKQSISNLEQGQRSAIEHRKQQVVTETRDSGLDTLLNEPLSTTSSSTRVPSRAGSTLKSDEKLPATVTEEDDDSYLLFEGPQQHRNISQSSSFSARVSPSLNSPNVIKDAESGMLNWTTIQQQQQESARRLFSGEEVDSQSGAGSADLESHSSSSLLDQLKSRGYRSMINQRNQEQVTSTTSCASTSLVESTSRSVIASSSVGGSESTTTTKLVQQKQVFTSSSSTAKGLLDEPEDQGKLRMRLIVNRQTELPEPLHSLKSVIVSRVNHPSYHIITLFASLSVAIEEVT